MTSNGIKARIEALYDEGLGPLEITRRSGSTRGYVDYVLRFYRSSSARTSVTAPVFDACDSRHIRAVAKASNNKGFPYCVAAVVHRPSESSGQRVDERNNAARTEAQ